MHNEQAFVKERGKLKLAFVLNILVGIVFGPWPFWPFLLRDVGLTHRKEIQEGLPKEIQEGLPGEAWTKKRIMELRNGS